MLKPLLFLLGLLVATSAAARGVYQEPRDFLREVFGGEPPSPKLVWLTGERRKRVTNILSHRPANLRLRYWVKDSRTVWILEEIGKEKPITVGIVVGPEGIERVKVLVFRESRGWEVRREAFTRQYQGAGLTPTDELDRHIDGISGATLSVRALSKLSRLALYLHREVSRKP